MLHQGTDVILVEFIAVREPSHTHAGLHRKALANCLAQTQALMMGKSADQAFAEMVPSAAATRDAHLLARHRAFPGNRPSTTLVLDALTPRSLGPLIALYEHRVFTSGAVWDVNSFDQWGVELGKALCNELLPRFDTADARGLLTPRRPVYSRACEIDPWADAGPRATLRPSQNGRYGACCRRCLLTRARSLHRCLLGMPGHLGS
jgi:hypothetical protein